MLGREELTAFPWGAKMKHLQNAINYQKCIICFQKQLMLLFCIWRKLVSFWQLRVAVSKVCWWLLLAACASLCCREPPERVSSSAVQHFSHFSFCILQIGESDNWCPHRTVAFTAPRKRKLQNPVWLTYSLIIAIQMQVFQKKQGNRGVRQPLSHFAWIAAALCTRLPRIPSCI